MGDIRILDPRFGAEMKHQHHHRPWPSSAYRNHVPASRGPSFCYRPMPPLDTIPHQWMSPMANHEYNYGRMPAGAGSSKGGDYYYLTPLYRNALPAPAPQALPASYQIPPSPRMVMDQHHHQRPSRNRSTKSSGSAGMGRHSVPPCTCAVGRTRSLEDVRSEMSEWEEYSDMNGNRIRTSPKNNVSKSRNGRRSMENLLEVDDDQEGGFPNGNKPPRHRNDRILDSKPGKRRGSYMVRLSQVLLL